MGMSSAAGGIDQTDGHKSHMTSDLSYLAAFGSSDSVGRVSLASVIDKFHFFTSTVDRTRRLEVSL